MTKLKSLPPVVVFTILINSAIFLLGASCQTVVSYCITFDFSDCNPLLNLWDGAEVHIETAEIHYNSSTPDDRQTVTTARRAPLGAIRRRFVKARIPVWPAANFCFKPGIYVGPKEFSFEEIFEWKHSRKPTAAELESMTDAQAVAWLNEWKGYYVICPDGSQISDEPVDISFREQYHQPLLPCLGSLTTAKLFRIGGKVLFPDGTECDLEEVYQTPSIYSRNTTVNNVVMKLSSDCPLCN